MRLCVVSFCIYPDFFVHPQGVGVEDEVAFMEASQSQNAALLSKLHQSMFGHIHFTG